jgi:DNA-binding transcriptional MerR regulator
MMVFTKGTDMKTWHVKEFAKLASISVRTLHHYDKIGLLKPSLRTESLYRLYSEKDLQRLERIIALKFFGFNLKQISVFIGKDEDLLHHLKAQQTCLALKIEQLHHANATINELLAASASTAIDWSKIAQLIEVYTMADYLKQDWVVETFSPAQLKQLSALDKKLSKAEQKEFETAWNMLFNHASKLVNSDPKSAEAQELAKNWMDLLEANYGDNEELKDAISMAYKHNKLPHRPFNQKLWDFIEAAVTHMQKKNK